MFGLPTTATAPFCPSEVKGSITIRRDAPFWRRLLGFAGPGLLISVGYMDPGNWATDIESGSRLGFQLLFVVLLSSLAAILLQTLSLRLGIAAGVDLARACRERYSAPVNRMLWLLAELGIIACDLAEVLGCALALNLLFGVSLLAGIAITAFDTLIVLGLKGKGFRQVEAIILGLVATIGTCYVVELLLIKPDWAAVATGYVPSLAALQGDKALYLAIGILGATVMPHNLYLHSSIVQTRVVGGDVASKRFAMRFSTIDTVMALAIAFLINSAILILAATVFHATGHQDVAEIQDAHKLLAPIVGTALAGTLFGIALLAAGQSSTFTGTIAGQILLEGFLDLKIPCYLRRLITRALALIPAFLAVWLMGEGAVGKLLVFSQVLLSFQLPFAIFPLLRLTGDAKVMGVFANSLAVKLIAWTVFGLITIANLWLIFKVIT